MKERHHSSKHEREWSSSLTRDAVANDDGGDWVMIGERPGEEIAIGLVSTGSRVSPFEHVPARDFRAFGLPGHVKTAQHSS